MEGLMRFGGGRRLFSPVGGGGRRLFSSIGWRRNSLFRTPQSPESVMKEMEEAKGSENWALFESWRSKFDKKYSSDEETVFRYKIFCESKEQVDKWNSEDHSYTLGLTEFCDLTAHDFPPHYPGRNLNANEGIINPVYQPPVGFRYHQNLYGSNTILDKVDIHGDEKNIDYYLITL